MMLAALFGFLPQAVVSIFGGVWADRHNRKYLIMGADAAIAASTLALALIMMSGYDAVWLIFLTMAIRSAGAGIQMPAVSALIPQITPTRNLMRVNGINGSIQSAMALLAPAAAGRDLRLVIGRERRLGGIARADLLHRRRDRDHRHRPARAHSRRAPSDAPADVQTGYFADLVDGVRYVAHHAFVRWLLVLFAIIFVLIVAPSNLTPLMLGALVRRRASSRT